MRQPQDYDPEPLIQAIVALDWNTDHANGAARVIQSTVADRYGEQLGDEDAVWILGSLLNRRLFRMQIHPNEVGKHATDVKVRRRAKFVRIPPDEPLTINPTRS